MDTHNYLECLVGLMADPEISIVEAIAFVLADPISVVLLAVGGVITGASMLVLGGLSFGSAVELLTER